MLYLDKVEQYNGPIFRARWRNTTDLQYHYPDFDNNYDPDQLKSCENEHFQPKRTNYIKGLDIV